MTPNGLIGGYDVRFEGGAVRLRLPLGLGEEEARAICERAQRGDGIESIEPDGSVRFTTEAAETMREVLGYDCDVLRPDEADDRVVELRSKLSELTLAV